MATFTEKESVTTHEGSGDGDLAVKATLMEGTGDDGETFEYVAIATGRIEETESVDGETVTVPNINDGPGETKSVGSPNNIGTIAEALEQLDEKLNGSK